MPDIREIRPLLSNPLSNLDQKAKDCYQLFVDGYSFYHSKNYISAREKLSDFIESMDMLKSIPSFVNQKWANFLESTLNKCLEMLRAIPSSSNNERNFFQMDILQKCPKAPKHNPKLDRSKIIQNGLTTKFDQNPVKTTISVSTPKITVPEFNKIQADLFSNRIKLNTCLVFDVCPSSRYQEAHISTENLICIDPKENDRRRFLNLLQNHKNARGNSSIKEVYLVFGNFPPSYSNLGFLPYADLMKSQPHLLFLMNIKSSVHYHLPNCSYFILDVPFEKFKLKYPLSCWETPRNLNVDHALFSQSPLEFPSFPRPETPKPSIIKSDQNIPTVISRDNELFLLPKDTHESLNALNTYSKSKEVNDIKIPPSFKKDPLLNKNEIKSTEIGAKLVDSSVNIQNKSLPEKSSNIIPVRPKEEADKISLITSKKSEIKLKEEIPISPPTLLPINEIKKSQDIILPFKDLPKRLAEPSTTNINDENKNGKVSPNINHQVASQKIEIPQNPFIQTTDTYTHEKAKHSIPPITNTEKNPISKVENTFQTVYYSNTKAKMESLNVVKAERKIESTLPAQTTDTRPIIRKSQEELRQDLNRYITTSNELLNSQNAEAKHDSLKSVPEFDRGKKPAAPKDVSQTASLSKDLDVPIKRTTFEPFVVGFDNSNSICYINSVLQSLFSNYRFRNLIEKINCFCKTNPTYLDKFPLLKALHSILDSIKTGEFSFIMMREIENVIFSRVSYLVIGEQEDAHEFYVVILDLMEQDIKSLICHYESEKLTKSQNPKIFLHDFHGIFYGKLHNKITCQSCKASHTNSEPFTCLSIQVAFENGSIAYPTVEQSLKAYFQQEILNLDYGWKCSKCNKVSEAIKTQTVDKMPHLLVIHLCRTTKFGSKMFHLIKFSLEKLFFDFPHENIPLKQNFELLAVVNHHGDKITTGHYTALCKRQIINNHSLVWMSYDDRRVLKISDPNETVITQNAYLLFFQTN